MPEKRVEEMRLRADEYEALTIYARLDIGPNGLTFREKLEETMGSTAYLLATPRTQSNMIRSVQTSYDDYARTFPDGFFACLDGERVVGQAGGIFLDFDFARPQHTIIGITGAHQCGNHDPAGAWYYGTDIAVDPDYRRRGIGQRLYALRKDLVQRGKKRGIIAGGHIPGYAEHKQRMSAADYVAKVAAGELYDATLSFQLQNGFEVRGVLANYIRDDAIDGWAALIVWENPDLRVSASGG
jgi:GNAT superfamily N-acetyltransferase